MGFGSYLVMFLMFVAALFLVVLVLIQRGKGGGLAGALGGMGGQSAFGTKAGDLFTRITIGVAAFWIVLCIVAIHVTNSGRSTANEAPTPPGKSAPAEPGSTPADGGDEAPAK
jgi:preprotein translocase subunit SecG